MVEKPTLTLPLSLYLVSPPRSCIASVEIRGIFSGINTIWAAAGIGFTLEGLDTVQVSTWPDWDAFLATVQPDQTIHSYYGHWENPPPDQQGQIQVINGIAVDRAGYVYVADGGNDRVQVFDAQGKFLLQWGGPGSGDGQFTFPQGIAVNRKGQVYVADYENHRIQVFAPVR